MNPKTDDQKLGEGLFRQDKNAFDAIYEKYWKRLFLYAFKILNDQPACEDMVQEVFVKLWQRAGANKITCLEAYLLKSMRYRISNYIRDRKDTAAVDEVLDHLCRQTPVDLVLEGKQTEEIINKSVRDLPEKRKQIFLLSREEQLSNKEIAYQLNISVRTVEGQLHKALKSIKKNLGEIYFWLFMVLWL
ncbi:RNA polymerase sigma-70 factor [Negadavirga shengliensis]|uniref:RNA polymerase sigma-70 factor n=1 Tax=Negadavirga shengliensis TaxID=1389218 RepID=A0ABV9SX50_9BACT